MQQSFAPSYRSITKLPIILKGILHPDDAKLGVAYGAKAIIVSNHGARQLDGVPASIDALPGMILVLFFRSSQRRRHKMFNLG